MSRKLKIDAPKGFDRYVKTGEIIDHEVRDPATGKMVKEKHEREASEKFAYGQVVEVDGVKITDEDAENWIGKGLASEVEE